MDSPHSSDMPKGRLSATNLALYHHLNCDLYLHNVYHRPADETDAQDGVPPSSRTQAHIERGLRWEQTLFTWLADQLLLLELPEDALPPEQIVDMIRNDARDHFFVVGLTLHPPQDFFNRLYDQGGLDRVMFSVAKPDLLEIFRPSRDTIIWRIIDAKSSDNVKASHYAQIYFYTLCLSAILQPPCFRQAGSAAIWLSSSTGQPSFGDLRPVALSLLAPSLHSFLFGRLPRLLVQPKDEVEWHYNPLCRNCPYESECRGTSLMEGTLGTVPNISHTEAHAVRTLLNLSRGPTPDAGISDIEELHGLFADASRWKTLESTYPATFNKARKILGVSRRRNAQGVFMSPPALDAAISGEIKVTQKRSYTCPQSEDIAVVLSLVKDPSVYSLPFSYFCLSVFTSLDGLQTQKPVTGLPPHLVSALASIIRDILQIKPTPTTQFYVFSSAEHSALQSHLVDSALNLTDSDEDLRLCIGALASGASLLRTTYQPIILSGALLPFSFGPGNHSSLEICAERLGIKSDASTNLSSAIRAKLRDVFLEFEIRNSMAEDESRRTLLGQLPRVVSIKSEVNRLLALPVPGYWDFEECANTLVTEDLGRECPKDDDILASLTSAAIGDVQSKLKWRNVYVYSILKSLRARVSNPTAGRPNILVNPGRRLTANCMDICEEEHLRKLFFMQQFEVLSRLTDLWKARIEGCPDAPIIEYQSATVGSRIERHFKVVSGAIDMLIDKEKNFYEYLLVAEGDDTEEIPVEALFDDLSVANLHFPLGVNSTDSWENQHPVVQDNLALADLLGVSSGRRKQATLTLQIWTGGAFRLAVGRRYRLSPRLVDFNTSKVLTTLFELDVRGNFGDPTSLPFWQLIKDPRSLRHMSVGTDRILHTAASLQRMFQELQTLGNDTASFLTLQASQREAAKRVLSTRLSVVWGPPGTGKTHTIALSILRLLDAERRLGVNDTRIIFISAMTNIAIDACLEKLDFLSKCYKNINHLSSNWLDDVKRERVFVGKTHQAPSLTETSNRYIYAGTVYQLYNFSKEHAIEVDAVVLDEAGQLGLSQAALVLRALKPEGRMIFAGDSEQLAPILSGSYPSATKKLFGSILDYLMLATPTSQPQPRDEPGSQGSLGTIESSSQSQGSIVQLRENFRLNPDLGEYISTIYKRPFKPQKTQETDLARQLQAIQHGTINGVDPSIITQVKAFFLALSNVMFRKPQSLLHPPSLSTEGGIQSILSSSGVFGLPSSITQENLPVSLSMIQLETLALQQDYLGYEVHVRAEAAVAAALVASIQICSPEASIFVATPYRNQRQAVKLALEKISTRTPLKGRRRSGADIDDLVEDTSNLNLNDNAKRPRVIVDTIERLQGSEAEFVICLFSLPRTSGVDMSFILERRRLNVAISRTKTLCILVTSSEVLRPTLRVLADERSAKGYAFLRAFEERAWSTSINVDLDTFEARG